MEKRGKKKNPKQNPVVGSSLLVLSHRPGIPSPALAELQQAGAEAGCLGKGETFCNPLWKVFSEA